MSAPAPAPAITDPTFKNSWPHNVCQFDQLTWDFDRCSFRQWFDGRILVDIDNCGTYPVLLASTVLNLTDTDFKAWQRNVLRSLGSGTTWAIRCGMFKKENDRLAFDQGISFMRVPEGPGADSIAAYKELRLSLVTSQVDKLKRTLKATWDAIMNDIRVNTEEMMIDNRTMIFDWLKDSQTAGRPNQAYRDAVRDRGNPFSDIPSVYSEDYLHKVIAYVETYYSATEHMAESDTRKQTLLTGKARVIGLMTQWWEPRSNACKDIKKDLDVMRKALNTISQEVPFRGRSGPSTGNRPPRTSPSPSSGRNIPGTQASGSRPN